MPVTNASTSERNFTPTSTGFVSLEEVVPGTTALLQMLHGHVCGSTVTVTGAEGAERLRLSSTARLRRFVGPTAVATQLKVQLVVPVAACQLAPPSTDTSTAATTPPTSLAVPAIVTGPPLATVAPLAGEVIVELGGVTSVDALAA